MTMFEYFFVNIADMFGITSYSHRTLSLFQDVLKNENIKLDWDFKVSLLSDAVRVSTKKTCLQLFVCLVIIGAEWYSKCQPIKIVIDRSFKFVVLITN